MGSVEIAESPVDADQRLSVPPRRQWPDVGLALAALLSVAAATLAVIAPYRAVFTASFSKVPGDREQVVDGWGHTPPSTVLAVHHGANFGLLLMICAAVALLAPALYAMGPRRPTARLQLRVVVAAVGAPALFVGVIAGLMAYEGGYGDQVKDLAAARGRGTASVAWGGCLYLSLVAAACTVLASAIVVRTGTARAAQQVAAV
jgi:hypothetical protein